MSEELKPCPFCGGEASVSIGHNGENEELMMYVECVSCAGMHRYTADAIAAWNTRDESEIDDLRKICASHKKRYEKAEGQVVNLKSQDMPCSAACFHHQTHPCEHCGRINGYLPSVWEALKEAK